MNRVESLNLFGVRARQLPCVTGTGAPTSSTEGAVGELYMDTETALLYKCTGAASGVYVWVEVEQMTEQTVAWADVTDKPETYPPESHTHAAANITGLAAVATSGSYASLNNVPSEFPPEEHTHSISAVSGLQNTLDSKAEADHAHTLDSLSNIHICETEPTTLVEGHWYLVKES